ncbi:DOMON domain-containing protein [Desulfotalea psychrophila]|uniref:DOMON domain-containing protein n=1 Tax=Desulfotalea psychrophila (strain LSv54 / DSM 12343) TaxID=177439 RepID=Q6AMM7_DESPS|nr:DOMON domain-containing protein [Desulfotalea psychrophila]CAG36398.1 unknown protein [Desulfotalea psychrophila LSv54]
MRFFLSVCALFLFLGTSVYAGEYPHRIKTSEMEFSWRLDADRLYVNLSAFTKSWVGIGFNPVKKMKGANFILGHVENGVLKLVDEVGTGLTRHQNDNLFGGGMDVTAIAGSLVNGRTNIEFSLPLQSGDINDSEINSRGENIILLAHGWKMNNLRKKHSYRAKFKVNLQTGKYVKLL